VIGSSGDALDLAHVVLFAGMILTVVGARRVLATLSRAEGGFSSLFVPPDRALGWPRGVQESDAPWAWRPAALPLDVLDDARPPDPDAPSDPGATALITGHRTYRAGPVRVAPIRLRHLPQ
jgi:hypothetical protein